MDLISKSDLQARRQRSDNTSNSRNTVVISSNLNGDDSSELCIQYGDGNEMIIGAEGGVGISDIAELDGKATEKKSLEIPTPQMNVEAVRLSTFRTWPHSAPVNPISLARAGLFYTGQDDVVECFSCHGQIKEWDYGDTAMGEHKQLFPDCDFVKGRKTNNEPMLKNQPSPQPPPDEKEDEKAKSQDQTTKTGGKKGKKKKKKKNKKRGDSKPGDDKPGDDDEDDDDENTNPSSIYNVDDDPQFQEANKVLKSEYKRLLTFIYWPKNAAVLPEDLARAGFYYCGSDDRVQCFCCYGILKNWRSGDVPMAEHRKYFTSCPFVRGEDVGNEPMRLTARHADGDNTLPKQLPTEPHRVENYQAQANRRGDGARNQSQQSQPKYPEYAEESARLATFENWPASQIVLPKNLAKAGFYYTGVKDNVKCFHCNVGLRNWEPTDEPWIEHARWFPKCDYVCKERGSAFMKYVATRFPQPYVPQANQQGASNAAASRPARPRVNDIMRSDQVQVVLDMGYSKELVKRVIHKKVMQTQTAFDTTHDLLIAVFEMEGELKDKDPSDWEPLEYADDEPEPLVSTEPEQKPKLTSPAASTSTSTSSSTSPQELTSETELKRELETLRDQKTCKVCMDRDVNMLFQPCGHLVTCEVCSAALRQCPICRKTIRSSLRTYMS